MSYYRGDYYRGDYYRGDPGILGSIVGAVGKVAKTAISLTPIGRAVSTATSVVKAVSGLVGGASGGSNLPVPVPQTQLPIFPGGTTNVPATTGSRAAKGQLEVAVSPLGTVGVHYAHKRRRMNVTNVRALRRALRRAHGFAHLARGVMSYELTGKKGRFTHFKAKRRGR